MTETGQSGPHLERMPAIDGLRAVAVYLVVAFHAGVARFEGGFIGVDVFFVLSGFLITRLLIVEYAGAGRIDLVGFYARRVRRLLPAAWVAVLVTSVVFVAFSNPAERASTLDDARAAIFYFANWHFIDGGQDYFAESITSSPFLHLWSLAVEEQFYLVWPVLSLGLLAVWRRRPGFVTAVVGVASVGAAWWAWSLSDTDLLRAYYATDTRAYQLLAGAALAFVLSRPDGSGRRAVSTPTSAVVVLVGLVAMVIVAVIGDVNAVERGMYAAVITFAVVGVIAGRVAGPAVGAERLLSSRPFVVLGGLSYATYLWHWPLVVLLERTLVLDPGPTLVVVALVSTALAKLSMDLIERPIRTHAPTGRRRADVTTVGLGIAGTVIIGLVLAPAILRTDTDQVRAAERPGFVPPPVTVTVTVPVEVEVEVPAEPDAADGTVDGDEVALDEPEPESAEPEPESAEPEVFVPTVSVPVSGPVPEDLGVVPIESSFSDRVGCVNIVPSGIDECIVTEGAGTRVMLVGDSHASKLNLAFAEYATANDLSYAIATMNGCAWQQGIQYVSALPVEGAKRACRDLRDGLYPDLVAAFEAEVVVLVTHDFSTSGYEVEPRPEWVSTAGLVDTELVDIASAETIAAIRSTGAEVIVVEPIPDAPFDVPGCLSGAALIEECAFVAAAAGPDTEVYRQLASDLDGVRVVDMNLLACPAYPLCDAIVDGVQVREDRDHLYGAYTLRIAEDLMALLGL
ncbi:MAG: acyltransferase family protein [Actinomycetota bacterium]